MTDDNLRYSGPPTVRESYMKELLVQCPKCKREALVRAADPIFGLPLWFQADVRRDLLWAYSRDNLKEIKSYVTSKLRERQTTSHTTMGERLPNFLKDSKNRETIVKVIERLEKKTMHNKIYKKCPAAATVFSVN